MNIHSNTQRKTRFKVWRCHRLSRLPLILLERYQWLLLFRRSIDRFAFSVPKGPDPGFGPLLCPRPGSNLLPVSVKVTLHASTTSSQHQPLSHSTFHEAGLLVRCTSFLMPMQTMANTTSLGGANPCFHLLMSFANLAIVGLAEVDRLLADLDKNLESARLSLKRGCCLSMALLQTMLT